MKRTVEIVLSIIGAILYLFGAIFGGVISTMDGDNQMIQEMLQEDPAITQGDMADVQLFLDGLGTIGIMLVVVSVIGLIAGIVAAILFKGNKKPKAAGIILLVVGVLATIVTVGTGIFAGLFYVIAGIMGLARKPKQEINMEQY
ncbi:DUF4064 domain-containing protein [Gracilibacillus massiliensis]|uniref:DUF4064 domain-containing protein n=1 Tax=Gracilibacillus massiliensis TaxID=1564956 RepID=UPI00071D5BC1|nr:DUF4064 domain-containing protein [Gracilibacillus massiliensis]